MLGLDQEVFLFGVYEKKRKEWWLCSSLSLFFQKQKLAFLSKTKAGARGRFVLQSLLLFSMDFTIIYKGLKKGMRCLSGMNCDL